MVEGLDVGLVGLGHEHRVAGIFVDDTADFFEDVVNLGQIIGVFVLDVAIAIGIVTGQIGIVVQVRIFVEARDCIDAEACNAALHPEVEHAIHGLVNFGIAPVEIGLLHIEIVVVVLARLLIPLPRRVAKPRLPVIRRLAFIRRCLAFAIAPDVPVAFGIVARRTGLEKPFVLVGGVVDHVVHDHADVALLCFGDKVVEIRHAAVERIDGGVIGDVVAVVDARRGIHGRDPDGVDAEVMQVVEARRDALDVADAVAVGVLKAARVDFVDDRVPPPLGAGGLILRRRRL